MVEVPLLSEKHSDLVNIVHNYVMLPLIIYDATKRRKTILSIQIHGLFIFCLDDYKEGGATVFLHT